MSVYFAEVGRYIKIGYSENPERRVRNLFKSATRYGVPDGTPLDAASRRLIRYIDGDTGTEFQIHQALRDFAVGNEWFVDEPEVRAFIARAECDPAGYEYVPRATGPAFEAYDESKLPAEERELLTRALAGMFRSTA